MRLMHIESARLQLPRALSILMLAPLPYMRVSFIICANTIIIDPKNAIID